MFALRCSYWIKFQINTRIDFKVVRHYQRKERKHQSKYVMVEKFSMKESEVGITEFVCNSPGFFGILRSRVSDFHVNEIDMCGNLAKLTSVTIPEPIKDDESTPVDKVTFWNSITKNKFRELEDMVDNQDPTKEVLIDVTGLDKPARTIIHNTIIEMYKEINTDLLEQSGIKFIRCKRRNTNECQQTKQQQKYTHFLLYKENVDTLLATRQLAQYLKPLRSDAIKYAGIKDKRAKTTQWASICGVDPKAIAEAAKLCPDIHVGNFKFSQQILKVGDLQGNRFRIAVRNINVSESLIRERLDSFKVNGFINYYGLQRFGIYSTPANFEIGLALIKGQFKEACQLILQPREFDIPDIQRVRKCWWETRNASVALKQLPSGKHERHDVIHLLIGLKKNDTNENEYVNGLLGIPLSVRKMYIHAYKSLIWNEMASMRLKHYGFKLQIGDLVYIDKVALNENEKVDFEEERQICNNNNEEFQHIKALVKALTETDIQCGKYNIYDVVLPVPGQFVQYPMNECSKWYKERLESDGLNYEDFGQSSLSIPSGGYRKLMAKPANLSYSFVNYESAFDTLILSDLEELQNKLRLKNKGPLKALLLDFCLSKSMYATMALREIMKINTARAYQSKIEKTHKNATVR